MAEEGPLRHWAVEEIPDKDALFMRVHKTWFKTGAGISLKAFQNRAGGMSTDWSRYSTAHETRERARRPGDNAVVQMITGEVRQVPGQHVQHSPVPANRAHTDVRGEKDEQARVLLGRLAAVVLPLSAP